MDKELNKAIKILKVLQAEYEKTLEIELEDKIDEPQIAYLRQQIIAIETVLNYIENSIPKKKVEDLIKSNAFEVYTRDYGNIDVIDIDSLQELLNKN